MLSLCCQYSPSLRIEFDVLEIGRKCLHFCDVELLIVVIVRINFGVRCLLPLEKFVQIMTATKVCCKI